MAAKESPAIPTGAIGFCYRCKRSVKAGTPWELIVDMGASRLVHKGCPAP